MDCRREVLFTSLPRVVHSLVPNDMLITVMGFPEHFDVIATKVSAAQPAANTFAYIVTHVVYPNGPSSNNRTPPCPSPPVLADLLHDVLDG